MKAEDRENLVAMIRQHPTAEIVLPIELYSEKHNGVRTQIDGIKVMLHRWLYDQLNPDNPLGNDRLRRYPEHNALNVNPLLMYRVEEGGRLDLEKCPQGHVYAETGEFPPGRGDRRRCRQCWRDSRNKINERDRVGGEPAAHANRSKTHCKFGHEYTPENTLYWPGDKGRRRCRECETDRSKQRYAERKIASGNAKES